MDTIESKRLILRKFELQDWPEILELAIDWKAAPGPESDKWPTTENECQKFTQFLSTNETFYAMCLRINNKVIGLFGLNGFDNKKQFDLGHVIHSKYKDNDYDREGLLAIIKYLFKNNDITVITTHNADDSKQIAPLKSIGFKTGNPLEGELILNKIEWEKNNQK